MPNTLSTSGLTPIVSAIKNSSQDCHECLWQAGSAISCRMETGSNCLRAPLLRDSDDAVMKIFQCEVSVKYQMRTMR